MTWNDPLKYTDPSGHSLLGEIIGLIVSIVIVVFAPELGLPLLTDELGFITAAVAGFAGGFFGALASTGSLSAALTAGLISGITALAFYCAGFIGSSSGTSWQVSENVLAHAAVGCASAAASGGNCGKGALSAAIADAATPYIIKFQSLGEWSAAPEAAEAGLIGGVAARIEGGKFTDGFSVAAAGYLFNQLAHRGADPNTRGAAAVQIAAQDLEDRGHTILAEYAPATDPLNPTYTRVYDLIVQDPMGEIGAIEVKSSIVGVLQINPQQEAFDIEAVQHNATVIIGGNSYTIGVVMYEGVGFGGLLNAALV
jgi:hypothetical protein